MEVRLSTKCLFQSLQKWEFYALIQHCYKYCKLSTTIPTTTTTTTAAIVTQTLIEPLLPPSQWSQPTACNRSLQLLGASFPLAHSKSWLQWSFKFEHSLWHSTNYIKLDHLIVLWCRFLGNLESADVLCVLCGPSQRDKIIIYIYIYIYIYR